MKIKRFYVVLFILLLGILLTSCTSATATNSWEGITASDTAVYFANGTTVVAAKADTGNVIWTYPEKPASSRLFYAAPAIAGDQIIVGDYSGLLVSIGVEDGKEHWQFTGAKGRYIDAPLVINDMIIAQNADANIYALNSNGKLIWSFKGSHAFWATPVSDGTTVYAPSLDHSLYALNLSDGKLKWKVDLGGPLIGRSVLSADNSTLFVGTLDKTFLALNSTDGSIKWKSTLKGNIWSAPVVLEDRLYVGDDSGIINMLKVSDGSVIQSIDVQSPVLGNGAVMNSNIVFGDEKGEIIVLGKNGERSWTRSLTGKLYSNLIFSNDHLYVLTTKGDKPLFAYDANGNEIWGYTVSK